MFKEVTNHFIIRVANKSVPSFVFSHNALVILLRRSYSLILIYYSIRTRLLYTFITLFYIDGKREVRNY